MTDDDERAVALELDHRSDLGRIGADRHHLVAGGRRDVREAGSGPQVGRRLREAPPSIHRAQRRLRPRGLAGAARPPGPGRLRGDVHRHRARPVRARPDPGSAPRGGTCCFSTGSDLRPARPRRARPRRPDSISTTGTSAESSTSVTAWPSTLDQGEWLHVGLRDGLRDRLVARRGDLLDGGEPLALHGLVVRRLDGVELDDVGLGLLAPTTTRQGSTSARRALPRARTW